MTLLDPQGRPVVRRDSTPASPDGPFVITLADPDLTLARLLTDNAVVQQQLSAGVVEFLVRSFGDGVGASARRQRGLAPKFLDGEQGYCLLGSGDRVSFSDPMDDALQNDQGSIAYRGQSLWLGLPPGASSFLLKTLGAGENPLWAISPGAIPLRIRVLEGGAADVTDAFAVLDDAKYLDIILIGSGGGGGQANASTASNISLGNAGGGGAACRHIITDPLSSYAYTLGAYGGNAAQGSQSTLVIPSPGTNLVASGGGAGSTIGNSNTVVVAGHTNGAAVATGGNVWNRGGKASGKTIRLSGTVAMAGKGGVSIGYGTGGKGRTTTGTGENGKGYGGGGSGGFSSNGAGSQAGGHGAPSALILVEYAAAS